jgi:hypothetical protein
MVRVAVSPEQSVWIAARVAKFSAEPPAQLRSEVPYVVEFGALPLDEGWFETIAIRPDGEIVSWSTMGDDAGAKSVDDRYVWLTSLVDGARRYETLRALLPSRPADAVDCWHLSHPLYSEGKVFCPQCCGLGWVQAGA